MIEIRFHGRGGQGAVTAATLLAKAAGYDDKYTQGFPAFSVERRGAPVKAFCRIANEKITTREQIYNPDYILILDPSLAKLDETSEGLKPDSKIIINISKEKKDELDFKNKTYAFDVTELALKVLGKDIVNTGILGVFAKVTEIVSLNSILRALEEVFDGKLLELNKELVTQAYNGVEND